MKSILSIHLLGCLLLVASFLSCETRELDNELHPQSGFQSRQGDFGPGIPDQAQRCDCDESCKSFFTQISVDPVQELRYQSQFDFQVKVSKNGPSCADYALLHPNCKFLNEFIVLYFPQDPNAQGYFSLADFSDWLAVDPNGDIIQLYELNNANGVEFGDEVTVYFRWKNRGLNLGVPSAASFSAGGICILGILIDPCIGCPGNSRRVPPIAPHRLRPWINS